MPAIEGAAIDGMSRLVMRYPRRDRGHPRRRIYCVVNVTDWFHSAPKERGYVQPVGIWSVLVAVTTLKAAVSLLVSNIRPDSEKKDVRLLQLIPVAGDISESMPKDDGEDDGPSREKYEPGLNITAKLVPADEDNYHGKQLAGHDSTNPTHDD